MILDEFREHAKQKKGKVVFAEGDEPRTLEAAVRLANDEICGVAVVSETKEAVEDIAKDKGLDLSRVNILIPSLEMIDKAVLDGFIEARVKKGMSDEEAKKLALEPLNFSALYVKSGKASGCVAGARSATSEVLKAAIYGVGTAEGTKLISSFFLMIPPENHSLIKDAILYADCGVNPNPNSLGLRDIAIASIGSFRSLFPNKTPKLAFLSFSTKGSAEHRSLQKIKDAVEAVKAHFESDSSVEIDGELQFDAAAVASVAKKKCPQSSVAGQANIYIFPDLNSGNICYKVTERLAGFTAIGPVVQGLEKPFNDLSRGCSVDDIYHAAVITLLQSKD